MVTGATKQELIKNLIKTAEEVADFIGDTGLALNPGKTGLIVFTGKNKSQGQPH